MPTPSMTAKVTRYCTSVTANEKRGGTKKKSKAATDSTAASMAGPRPHLTATITTQSKKSMTILAKSNRANMGMVSSVVATQAASVQP